MTLRQQMLLLPLPFLSPLRLRLPEQPRENLSLLPAALGLIRRGVLQQVHHPGLLFLFVVFVCQLGCGSGLVSEYVPLRWQHHLRGSSSCDAATVVRVVAPCCRRQCWAPPLLRSSNNQDKHVEHLSTITTAITITTSSLLRRSPSSHSRKASCLNDKRLRILPTGIINVCCEPSSRAASYQSSNSSRVANWGSPVRDAYPFHSWGCGCLSYISPSQICAAEVIVARTCQSAPKVRHKTPVRVKPQKSSLRACVNPDTIEPPVLYRCRLMKDFLRSRTHHITQSESEPNATALPPSTFLMCYSPNVTYAPHPPPPPEAIARTIKRTLHRGANSGIFGITCGTPLRQHALGKTNSSAVSATAARSLLPGRSSPVTFRTFYLTKSADTKAAARGGKGGGVVPLLPSVLYPAAFFSKDSSGVTPAMKQKLFLRTALDGSREGIRHLMPLEELERDALFAEEAVRPTAATIPQNDGVVASDNTAVDDGERSRSSSKGKKEARQRDYLLVGKRRESKQKKQGKKEIRLTPRWVSCFDELTRIAAHDLLVKAKQARQFLLEKKQVLFSVHLRGRELAACSLHRVLLERVAEMLSDVAAPANAIQQKGNTLMQLFQYRKPKKGAPNTQMYSGGAITREALSSTASPTTACPETGSINRETA